MASAMRKTYMGALFFSRAFRRWGLNKFSRMDK